MLDGGNLVVLALLTMGPKELKAIRAQLGFSQADLARALGVSRAAVCYWEKGKRKIDNVLVLALEHLLEHRKEARHGKRSE